MLDRASHPVCGRESLINRVLTRMVRFRAGSFRKYSTQVRGRIARAFSSRAAQGSAGAAVPSILLHTGTFLRRTSCCFRCSLQHTRLPGDKSNILFNFISRTSYMSQILNREHLFAHGQQSIWCLFSNTLYRRTRELVLHTKGSRV